MEPPTTQDWNEWLRYALQAPSTNKVPHANLKVEDLGWIVELDGWVGAHKINKFRERLINLLPIMTLFAIYLDSVTPEEAQIALTTFQMYTDEEVRQSLSNLLNPGQKTPTLSLYALLVAATKFSNLKKELDALKLEMWELIQHQIHNSSFKDFPASTSPELQRSIIAKRCRLEADFLSNVSQDTLRSIVQKEGLAHGSYLNHDNLCRLVTNLNTVVREKTLKEIEECQKFLNTHPISPLNLSPADKEKLQTQMDEYRAAIRAWHKGNEYYLDCDVGNKALCSEKVKRLEDLAEKVRKFGKECIVSVHEAYKADLKNRKDQGGVLTLKEEWQRVTL